MYSQNNNYYWGRYIKLQQDRIVVNKFFSKRVFLLRKATNKSRASLAFALNLSPITLMRIEVYNKNKELSVNANTLKIIAEYFNVSEDWIKSDVDDLKSETTKKILLRVKIQAPLIESMTNAGIDSSTIPKLSECITDMFILLGTLHRK